MTQVNPSVFIDCDAAVATVAFEVIADVERGPYEVTMYGTVTGGRDVVIGTGLGKGVFARNVNLANGDVTYGATVHFLSDGTESSTGEPINLPAECTIPTTVPEQTTTTEQPATTVPLPDPTTTTIYYCPGRPEEPPIAGCIHPTSPPSIPGRVLTETEIGTATSITAPPKMTTLPVTGLEGNLPLVAAGLVGVGILCVVAARIGKFRRPRNGNGAHS